MSSRFEFIKSVKDVNFNSEFPQLYEECKKLERLQIEYPAPFIKEARALNEVLIDYLYRRIMGVEESGLTTDQILKDEAFKKKVNNDTLIEYSNRIKRDGNAGTHKKKKSDSKINADAELAAESIMGTLVAVSRKICEIITQLPPPLMAVQKPTQNRARLTGTISIELKEDMISPGVVRRYLLAHIDGFNVENSKLILSWYYPGPNNRKLNNKNSNIFDLPKKPQGKAYICVVTSEEREGKRVSNIYRDENPAAAIKVPTNSKQSVRKNDKQRQDSAQLAEPVGEKPKVEDTATTITATGRTTTTFSKREQMVPELSRCELQLFNSAVGLVHYFVCPDDKVVLNSFEMLDMDTYLYRVLKSESYERIVFIKEKNMCYEGYAYDEDSEALFRSDVVKGLMSSPRKVGKKLIARFSKTKDTNTCFIEKIVEILRNKEHKSAVVILVATLGKESFYKELIEVAAKIEEKNNVLILTMPGREDIIHCFDGENNQTYPWISEIVADITKDDSEKANRIITNLKVRDLVVLADKYESDEIANLLFRKKLIERRGLLMDIPTTKIHPLADRLREHCLQGRKYFRQIPYQNYKGSCIQQLDVLLDRNDVQKELCEKATDLKIFPVTKTRNL